MIVWKIALRNLREHKTKTIIVGILIAVAMTILVAGNSLIDSLSARMEQNYRNTYTGDVVVYPDTEFEMSLFGVTGLNRLNATTPALENIDAVRSAVEQAGAAQVTYLVFSQGTFLHEEQQVGIGTFWGIEPESYFAMFGPQVQLVEGRRLEPGERGILVSGETVDQIEQEENVRYRVGDTIAVSATSAKGGIRIREVPIVGVIGFDQPNPQLQSVSLLDAATTRELAGLDVESIDPSDLAPEERKLLGSVSEESLFGGGVVDEGGDATVPVDVDSVFVDGGGSERTSSFELDKWNFVIAMADGPADAPRLERDLRPALSEVPGASVGDWQWAAGASITLVVSLQLVFNVIVLVISIVSVIIIVNTLIISISERIPEIGTIRAIGGKRRLVRALIARETLVITGAFGLVGIAVGAVAVGITAAVGIPAESRFLQLLLGGENFRPAISATAIVSSLASVAIMGWVAGLYPIHVATRISPVAAMQRG